MSVPSILVQDKKPEPINADEAEPTTSASDQPSNAGRDASTGTGTPACKTSKADKCSIASLMCRICYDDTLDEPIVSLCQCKVKITQNIANDTKSVATHTIFLFPFKGSVAFVHKSCLERWLAESNTSKCDLCHQAFETERTPKYTVSESLYRWLRYPPQNFAFPVRDLRADLITCLIILPITFSIVYIGLYAADYYNRSRFMIFPFAKWTAYSIMLMGIAILLGFSTWMYLVLKYHLRVWFFWWQRETYVRVQLNKEQSVVIT